MIHTLYKKNYTINHFFKVNNILNLISKLILSKLIILWIYSNFALGFDTTAKSAIVYDETTKSILFEKFADKPLPPASMSKLMTLYILFDSLDKGIVSLEDKFFVSRNAYQKEGSTIYAELETEISVENLIRGIVVSSGNDACVIVAEALSGSEESFAQQMNYYAVSYTHLTLPTKA